VAVTGSNGKTTVKEMIAAILGRRGPVLATQGNLNNEIGVPLTLARLSREHQGAVIEMGANHAGEIAYLTALAKPGIAVITNAGPAHLEGFGSLEGVASAKGEVLSGLPDDGVAIVNADDVFAGKWRALAAPHRVIDFGLTEGADVQATWQPDGEGSQVCIVAGGESIELKLALPGKHNVMNALAAVAAGIALDIGLDDIAAGLTSMCGVQGRLQVKARADGLCVIDDTYNANPASLNAALDVLARMKGERWLVLGDMAELGEDAVALHRRVARVAQQAGVTRLYGLGELGTVAADAFGAGGIAFNDRTELEAELALHAGPGDTVLVKGSRRMGMEHVVQALLKYSCTPKTSPGGMQPC
jgi:UDP-N-acetylmuramoyl-tripeptide--D-alanyl-D-alanine ligase